MITAKRRLAPQLRSLLASNNGWPDRKSFERWQRTNDDGIKNGIYADMVRGYAVGERYIVGFAKYLQSCPTAPPLAVELISQFLGSTEWLRQSAHTVAARLIEDDDHDFFKRGTDGLLSALLCVKLIGQQVSWCRKEQDVEEAVRWMYVHVARHVHPDAHRFTVRESERVAASHMRIERCDYAQRAVSWWRYDPWTVIRVKGKKGPVGMCIHLPLSREAYESLKSGARMSYDIRAEELSRPSPYLLVEGIAERLPLVGGPRVSPTNAMILAMVTQQSVLSVSPPNDWLRMLSFTGTPASRERLESFGFKPLNTFMPSTDIEWMEKTWGDPVTPRDYVFLGLLTTVGRGLRHRLSPPTNEPDDSA